MLYSRYKLQAYQSNTIKHLLLIPKDQCTLIEQLPYLIFYWKSEYTLIKQSNLFYKKICSCMAPYNFSSSYASVTIIIYND